MKSEQQTVTVTLSEGNEKSKGYTRTSFETAEDVLGALSGAPDKVKELIANLNYGTDLKVRAAIRQEILNEFAGPDRAIDKLAKDLVKLYASMGQTITLEDATVKAKSLSPAVPATPAPAAPATA